MMQSPVETSSASIPRAQDEAPIVEVCSGGDMVLNIRQLGFDESGPRALNTTEVCTEGRLLGRFRVSSVALQMASHYVKDYLDTTLRSPTPVSGGMAPAATALPLLWLHMDGNENLNLLTQSKLTTVSKDLPGVSRGGMQALVTLLRIIHFNLDSRDPVAAEMFDVGVMTALVAEFAYSLSCLGPVVPWINLWLTRDLPETAGWYRSAKGHYVGIALGYVMGDEIAFRRWSQLCINYGTGSGTFAGVGYVWSVINDDLQKRRRKYVEELLAVLDETWNQYHVDQPTATRALATSVALGSFSRAVHRHLGHLPPFASISWHGSIDDLMLVLQEIKKSMDTVWEAFTTHYQDSKTLRFLLQTPADLIWQNSVNVWARISGLELNDYRLGVQELLDVKEFLDSSIPVMDVYCVSACKVKSRRV